MSNTELVAVKRTMQIIELLASHPEGLSLSEIVEKLGIQKSTVSKILTTLETSRYVRQDKRTRHFALTWNLVALAQRFADALPFEEFARPILRNLAQTTGELVQLAVVDNEELIFIAKAEGTKTLRVASMLGRTAPLHASAVGKVWLASLPEARVRELLARRGMPKITRRTITDPEVLLDELEQVRRQGYALAWEEVNETVVALAVPIHSEEKKVQAALVVAIPAFEATDERLQGLRAACLDAAKELEQQMIPISG